MGNNYQAVVVLFLVVFGRLGKTHANANVGCLFGDQLCEPTERCFADNAFGRCISEYATPTEEDLYRFSLDPASLSALEAELERMLALGYGWRHPYTQCTIQSLLQAIQYDNYYDPDGCADLSDPALETRILQDIDRSPQPENIMPGQDNLPVLLQEAILKEELNPMANLELNDNDENNDDENSPHLAFVKFTPSATNPHADFADEIYMPPNYDNLEQQDQAVENTKFLEAMTGIEAPPGFLRRFAYPNQRDDNSNLNDDEDEEKEDPDESLWRRRRPNLLKKSVPWLQRPPDNYIPYNTDPDFEFEQPEVSFDIPSSLKEPLSPMDLPDEFQYYNTPDLFRAGFETRDSLEPGQMQQEHQPNRFLVPIINAGYTEGGVVRVGQDNKQPLPSVEEAEAAQVARAAEALDDGLDALLEWGRFQRRERLDVKKPGPLYATNNYAFNKQTDDDTTMENTEIEDPTEVQQQIQQPEKMNDISTDEDDKEPYESPSKKEIASPTKASISSVLELLNNRKNQDNIDPLLGDDHYDIVDTSFAYIEFTHSIRTWQEGEKIVKDVSRVLHLPPKTFTHIRVDRNEVTFKVETNDQGLNASQIAKKLADMKDELKDILGLEVTGVGIGDKTKLPTAVVAPRLDSQQQLYLALLACAMLAGLCTAAAALLLVRRARAARAKLSGLATAHDSEPSKDYQDLCRARMKGSAVASSSNDKPTGSNDTPLPGHRVTNLSRESEGSNPSPSSRSSTSSWSEEPALTNMDISTGHMVLSYMEDHLKNKDRLEQEWLALCAYEAEPCATTIALNSENSSKNRYGDVVPYDHARVVLNDLTNLSGSDYINASTITDHDPRNPAYIATQGPLPSTAADLWQMVWEQGSVVMVMLTRLTENGQAMCHRYWPEEGSELYHIYEVHLVSEHIWCDDYLVRSFYLKNLRTGETRTVTQFHFLSWPENGVPHTTKALLEFRRKVNKSYRGRSCPIVVHCSDGAGRTGTYCLMDMVLNRMAKGAKEIDIAATLEHIRDQRPAMVRTREQFVFVLAAVADEVHAILKALPTVHKEPQPQQQQQPQQQH